MEALDRCGCLAVKRYKYYEHNQWKDKHRPEIVKEGWGGVQTEKPQNWNPSKQSNRNTHQMQNGEETARNESK